MISEVQRIPTASVDPTAKNYHWNDLTMGLFGALDAGADSVLLVDPNGNVVEGPGFNVFCTRNGGLVTPAEGMLEGVTRRTVIEMARCSGIEVQTRNLPASELRSADEVFISTSGGGVLPVTVLDKVHVGDGRPGPIAHKLIQTNGDWHTDPAYSSAIDYPI